MKLLTQVLLLGSAILSTVDATNILLHYQVKCQGGGYICKNAPPNSCCNYLARGWGSVGGQGLRGAWVVDWGSSGHNPCGYILQQGPRACQSHTPKVITGGSWYFPKAGDGKRAEEAQRCTQSVTADAIMLDDKSVYDIKGMAPKDLKFLDDLLERGGNSTEVPAHLAARAIDLDSE